MELACANFNFSWWNCVLACLELVVLQSLLWNARLVIELAVCLKKPFQAT